MHACSPLRSADGSSPGLARPGEHLEAPRKRPQLEYLVCGRLPPFKWHTAAVVTDELRVDLVGLRAMHPCAVVVLQRPRVDAHHVDTVAVVERQSQVKAVDAGRFDGDAHERAALPELLDEMAVSSRRVVEAALTEPVRAGLPAGSVDPVRTDVAASDGVVGDGGHDERGDVEEG